VWAAVVCQAAQIGPVNPIEAVEVIVLHHKPS
jgi:hypothetical protein